MGGDECGQMAGGVSVRETRDRRKIKGKQQNLQQNPHAVGKSNSPEEVRGAMGCGGGHQSSRGDDAGLERTQARSDQARRSHVWLGSPFPCTRGWGHGCRYLHTLPCGYLAHFVHLLFQTLWLFVDCNQTARQEGTGKARGIGLDCFYGSLPTQDNL